MVHIEHSICYIFVYDITANCMTKSNTDSLVQDSSNSIPKGLELLQSCAKPSIWSSAFFLEFSYDKIESH